MTKLGMGLIPDVKVTVRPKVILAVVGTVVVLGATAFNAARAVIGHVDRTSHAVQDTTFRRHVLADSLHHALQDSVMTSIARRAEAAAESNNELTCHVYSYPAPYCDEHRRKAQQAGRIR